MGEVKFLFIVFIDNIRETRWVFLVKNIISETNFASTNTKRFTKGGTFSTEPNNTMLPSETQSCMAKFKTNKHTIEFPKLAQICQHYNLLIKGLFLSAQSDFVTSIYCVPFSCLLVYLDENVHFVSYIWVEFRQVF